MLSAGRVPEAKIIDIIKPPTLTVGPPRNPGAP
jgi:hypothetical protein